ncbi:pyridoxal phosphate-dependent aminotransferase [Cognatishimia sp. 1_MG-2023]|uniref:pyridoxal phosphate-dependent aminotransferase n=1 Tax=Cognatishimia sp. 1_MG-2023 TaxID=3062642 RepID=UPI0026E3827B|nr:pyridoxal phosphate-dependent aminotransferase [Cognatishimia sp. 1_MG-2023]MDO6726293.1 pyridoxal phosphate-dependent aminotransferase [Cognatishimia sp. 1_MG-2023]
MTGPRYTPLVQSLSSDSPFVGPERHERAVGHPFKARLGANENGFGPSPKAITALQEAAKDIWMYADSESFDLRTALAARHKVSINNILIGEGIDGLLGDLVRLLITTGDSIVTSAGAYPTLNYHVAGHGGTIHTVPFVDDHEDLPSLIAKAHETDAKMIYIANPDNPMGTWHTGAEIAAQLDNIPDGCLLILDEAYVELAPKGTAAEYDVDHPNVIRMRTFSKGYGLAGARIGYAMAAAPLIKAFDKIRLHFGVNRASQAGALAALQDEAWLTQTRENVATSRATLAQIAKDNGLTAIPSATNFVTIDTHRDGTFAKALVQELATLGVFIRMPFVAPQNRCIRVSCGTAKDMQTFAEALPQALKTLQGKSL